MPLDPKIFENDPYGPFPDKGQRIRGCKKGDEPFEGTVVRIFLAMDAVAICVATGKHAKNTECTTHLIPEFGDTWEAIT